MASRARIGLLLAPALAVALTVAPALRAEEATPELDAERDVLLDKLLRGEDWDASVKRFAALVKQRDAIVATSAAAREAQRAEAEARRKWRDEYEQSGDYQVADRCTLSPDPAHPIPSSESRLQPDWGKIVRREQARLPAKNALDEGEPITLYELKGLAGSWQFRGEHTGAHREPFSANVGDLVLLCHGGEDSLRDLPAGWGPRIVTSGFALPIARPPLIVEKARWQPIHITRTALFWAIHDVKWKYPEGSYVLANIEIDKDLGNHEYEIATHNQLSWILAVPPSLKRQELLVVHRSLWAIMGKPRFDRTLKKLVLEAADLEARYVFDK